MKPSSAGGVEPEEDNPEQENKLINEEYKIWKKNAPYLYDVVVTHVLKWPSLTCQWFPDRHDHPDLPYTTHRLLLGTHTSDQQPDFLHIATLQLPKRDAQSAPLDRRDYDAERGELGSYKGHTAKITITQSIKHPKEVNRARYMPQNPDLIATKTVDGPVLIFDRTKHPDEAPSGDCKPDLTLVGHTKEGFGLAWNPSKAGIVLSASEDMTVCAWDINSYTKGNSTITATTVFKGHTSVVGDVDWHATDQHLFASVGDDKQLLIWDTRSPTAATRQVQAHEAEILAVKFSMADENLLVTGSSDKTCALWDARNFGKRLHTFESHVQDITSLAWSPHAPTVFASASSDRRINVWDISRIGQEQTPDDAEDGPPELMFMHGGHTAAPSEFCWAPGEPEVWTLASVSDDNIVMVWSPSMRIWAADDVKVDAEQLEVGMEGVDASG